MVENTTKAPIIGSSLRHVTNFRYLTIITAADVSESSPDRVTASPYEGIRNGRAVIMKIPKPNPTVRCTKLAPAARRIMYRAVDGIWETDYVCGPKLENNFGSAEEI